MLFTILSHLLILSSYKMHGTFNEDTFCDVLYLMISSFFANYNLYFIDLPSHEKRAY